MHVRFDEDRETIDIDIDATKQSEMTEAAKPASKVRFIKHPGIQWKAKKSKIPTFKRKMVNRDVDGTGKKLEPFKIVGYVRRPGFFVEGAEIKSLSTRMADRSGD